MAARKNIRFLDDKWKERIGASMLINRLKRFANSKFDPRHPDYMAPHQVQAAAILLRKVVPDLAAVEHSGEVQVQSIVNPEPLAVEWKAEFADAAPKEGIAQDETKH